MQTIGVLGYPFKKGFGNGLSSKLLYELLIVDIACYFPWGDYAGRNAVPLFEWIRSSGRRNND